MVQWIALNIVFPVCLVGGTGLLCYAAYLLGEAGRTK